MPISLQNGLWPSIRIVHAVEDEFTEEDDVRKEYGEDDHFVGHRCDHPPPSFQIGRDLYVGYFVALRPQDKDNHPFGLYKPCQIQTLIQRSQTWCKFEFYVLYHRIGMFRSFIKIRMLTSTFDGQLKRR